MGCVLDQWQEGRVASATYFKEAYPPLSPVWTNPGESRLSGLVRTGDLCAKE